ncbi:MAG: isochorismatase family protein [Actinomycetota bacterium]|nr:isochorismatase family protein [Actinomycetota bacterium]
MATDPDRLRQLVAPAHTAVLTMELQNGIVGDGAILPMVPEAVQAVGLLQHAAAVCRAARAAGVRVVHGTAVEREDGAGAAVNCKIFAIGEKRRLAGSSPIIAGSYGAQLVPELEVQPSDIEVPRIHGMTPFTSTALDQILRNLGVTTVVIMGVSLNLGIMGASLTALDLGYQVVVVGDAVAGIPKEYADAVLANSISMIATVVGSDELIAAWSPTT